MNSLKKYFANNRYYTGKPRNDREARNLTTRKAMKYLGVFKNDWVLHYTNNPIAIITQGFMGLVGDKDDIWRTYACPALREIDKGYCFAFDANDENHFSYDYGPYALMFRVSGIKAYNCVDEEPQVIFKAENANLKECFMLTFSADTESDYDGEGEPYTSYRNMTINVINPYTKKTVFSTPDMKRAIEWVKTNYRQYKKLNSFNNTRKYKSVDDTLEQTTKEVVNYIKNELGRNVIGVFNDNYHTTREYVIVLPADEYASKGKIRKALGFKPKDYTCDVRNNIILSFEYEIQRHFIRRFIGDDVQGDYFNLIRLSYDNTETLEHKIKSTVKSVLKEYVNRTNITLNENYHGEIYHFTTLPMLYCIVRDNSLIPDRSDQEQFINYPRKGTRDEYDEVNPFLCFTRNKNYNIRDGACVYCKLTFDADKLMNLRNARLYPVNWSGKTKMNNPSEFEERLYNTDIYPFDKYVERIDIFVKDITGDMEDGGNDLEDELYDLYTQKYPNKNDDEIVAMYRYYMINTILNNPKLKGKVFVHQ